MRCGPAKCAGWFDFGSHGIRDRIAGLSELIETPGLEAEALRLGFDVCDVADAGGVEHGGYFREWLREGRHGGMEWMERDPDRRIDPRRLQPECRSVILLGTNYYRRRASGRGVVARYAMGGDYHDLLKERTRRLIDWLEREHGGAHRPFVDTSAVMEKGHARKTAIGWQGKNTMLIHERFGNWLFLSGILTTLAFRPGAPNPDRCGSCRRCIDACPTRAITGPYRLDARRCISYLTIEHRGAIPPEFREAVGDRLFGCDDCLEVCPWNRWAVESREAHFDPRALPDLRDMLAWRDAEFRAFFRGTPVFRLKWNRWLRNVCVVLGNIGGVGDLPALRDAAQCGDALVAGHADWAVERITARRHQAETGQ